MKPTRHGLMKGLSAFHTTRSCIAAVVEVMAGRGHACDGGKRSCMSTLSGLIGKVCKSTLLSLCAPIDYLTLPMPDVAFAVQSCHLRDAYIARERWYPEIPIGCTSLSQALYRGSHCAASCDLVVRPYTLLGAPREIQCMPLLTAIIPSMLYDPSVCPEESSGLVSTCTITASKSLLLHPRISLRPRPELLRSL